MKTIEEIYEETHKDCSRDNCQSWPRITKECMKNAQKELFEEIWDRLEYNNHLIALSHLDNIRDQYGIE